MLGIDQVGVHDDFYELGGDSLRMIQVLARLRDAFQIEMAIKDLSGAPTIAKFAEQIETIRWARERAGTSLEPVESAQVEGEI